MQFHEYVLGADNRIQDVPVFITVACFLVSEGASLETTSVEGITPLHVCPPEYESLLQLFARPERYMFYCFQNTHLLRRHALGEVIIEGAYPDILLLLAPDTSRHRFT